MNKIIYVITTSNSKIDKIEEAFFCSPLVTTNLLHSYRCVQRIINEHAGRSDFKVEYEKGNMIAERKKLSHLNYFKNGKKFHNVPIDF